jgi:outer membrane receptor protein involved in Fe transport
LGRGYSADGVVGLDSRIFTNLSMGWRPQPELRLQLSITNVFEVDPPIDFNKSHGYSPGTYDNRGRGYALIITRDW